MNLFEKIFGEDKQPNTEDYFKRNSNKKIPATILEDTPLEANEKETNDNSN